MTREYVSIGSCRRIVISTVDYDSTMKRNTVRLKDRADAELLKERFELNEED